MNNNDNDKLIARPELHVEEERPIFEFRQIVLFGVYFFAFLLGVSVLFIPWQYVVAVFLGMVLLMAIFGNLYIALVLFLIGAIFHPTYHFQALQSLHPARNLAFLLLVAWGLHTMVYRDFRLVKNPQNTYVMLFLCSVFLASTQYFDFSINFFMEFASKAFVLYFAISSIIKDESGVKRLIYFLIFFMVISASIGIYQYVYKIGVFYRPEGILRISGPDEDANVFAMNLTLTLPLVLSVIFSASKKMIKYLLSCVAVLLMITVILTFSRAGMLQLFTVLWMMLGARLIRKYKALGWLFAIFLVIAVLPLIPVKYFERLETILNFSDPAIGKRLDGWKIGLGMIADHPFRGVGFGIFRFEFLERAFTGVEAHFKLALEAHNLFIQTAAEIGILGIVFLVLIIIQTFRNMISAKKNFLAKNDCALFEITNGLVVSFIIYIIGGMFISYLQLLIFWIIVPLSVVLKKVSEEELPREQ